MIVHDTQQPTEARSPLHAGTLRAFGFVLVLLATMATCSLQAIAQGCNGCAVDTAPAIENSEKADSEPSDREAYIRRAVRGSPLPHTVVGKRQRGSGSGFFINRTELVTNHHVVDGCSGLTVRVGGSSAWMSATLIASDALNDLAVVRVDGAVERTAVLSGRDRSDAPKALTIIGYPELRRVVVKPVAVEATLASSDHWGRGRAFAVRAIVRHGHSGSPVIDDRGLVVGVITKRVNPLSLYRKTGRIEEKNIGVAVSASVLERFLKENAISHEVARTGKSEGDFLADAWRYVAQIGCWK